MHGTRLGLCLLSCARCHQQQQVASTALAPGKTKNGWLKLMDLRAWIWLMDGPPTFHSEGSRATLVTVIAHVAVVKVRRSSAGDA